jgi:16S rRNA (uracil1498-N3)-methyltransferase
MQLPYFYNEALSKSTTTMLLDETTSKHMVQVLRMQAGEQLKLTNGKGLVAQVSIVVAHKKQCSVSAVAWEEVTANEKEVSIAISALKNASRFEWFIEKAVEIGVTTIQLLQCSRTEKQNIRLDRLQGIAVSGMLQSQQAWLMKIEPPLPFAEFVQQQSNDQKLVAHCLPSPTKQNLATIKSSNSKTILIGPEGDFTPHEIEQAIAQGYIEVSLGNTRLRTETAGIVAATLLTQLPLA